MTAARLASSLVALRSEVDKLAPSRSRVSDGWIGDAAHASRRSHHNPDPAGWVDALDITHDPAGGLDAGALIARIVARRDGRVEYLIWRGQLWRAYRTEPAHPPIWTPEPYRGTNPHTRHAHVCVWRRPEGRTASPAWLGTQSPKETPEMLTDAQNAALTEMLGLLRVTAGGSSSTLAKIRDTGARLEKQVAALEARLDRLEDHATSGGGGTLEGGRLEVAGTLTVTPS